MQDAERGRLHARRLSAFAALGALGAGALLADTHEPSAVLRGAAIVAEVAVLALLVRRVRDAATELRGVASDDLLVRIGALTDPLLRVLGAELVVVYYAFVGPFVRRPARDDEHGYAEQSGLGGLLFALGLVVTMEGIGAHCLIHAWSPAAAWVHAAMSAYGLVWLAAAHQAARLRPVLVREGTLLVRTSVLWTAEVPLEDIAEIQAVDAVARGKDVLRAALGTAPVLLVTLTCPVTARWPFGARSVRRIALYVDDPARLRTAIERRRAAQA